MKHLDVAVSWRSRLCIWARGEQRNPGISFADESRHAIPHVLVKSLEPENFDVPFCRSLNVADADSYVINAVEFHHIIQFGFLAEPLDSSRTLRRRHRSPVR